jgi:hypothetical protein
MTFGDWAGALQSLVQVAAIAAAAVWGYYKFARGRTFAHRAEATVEGDLLRDGDRTGMAARLTLKNTGATDIPLRVKAIYVYGLPEQNWGAKPEWVELGKTSIFDHHEWIEAQETIFDSVLVPLTDAETSTLAYRLEARIYERTRRRWWRKPREGGIRWTATAVVPGVLTSDDRGGDDRE